jgi:NAD(P)-dependent dehydrogenase (short-subunit alcohol dehydrogenase family)
MSDHLASRRFSVRDQLRFAELSGDSNPIHLDALEARRSFIGEPIVHGVHCVLWALENYVPRLDQGAGAARHLRLTRLNFKLPNAVRLEREIDLRLVSETSQPSARLRLRDGGQTLADISLSGEFPPAGAAPHAELKPLPAGDPRELGMDEIANLSGFLDLAGDAGALRAAFPNCCRTLGVALVAQLLAVSRLVGMECPGRHSLLFAANLEFSPAPTGEPMRYSVAHAESKLARLKITLSGAGCQGQVTAFLRPAAVAQPALAEIAPRFDRGTLAGRHALIVGGSRGLGETVAKIIAASGGEVAISYVAGAADAARVAGEINDWGGQCRSFRLDVAAPENIAEALAGWRPDQLYYFATPAIFGPRNGRFDRQRFLAFIACYVAGFNATVRAVRPLAGPRLDIFFPSSVAVETADTETIEYAAAKICGETLCREIARRHGPGRVLVKRLPRLATDQTASLRQFETADAVAVMGEIVGEMAADN